MKKVFTTSLFSAFLLLSMVSCLDTKDFALDKLSTSDLKPTLSIPLFTDSLYLKPGTNIKYLGDTVAFFFSVPTPDVPTIASMADIPPVVFGLPTVSIPNPGAGIPPNLSSASFSQIVTVPFPAPMRVDSVVVNNMMINVTSLNNFNSTYTISFSAAGSPLSATFTLSVEAGGSASLTVNGSFGLSSNQFNVAVSMAPELLPAGTPYNTGGNVTIVTVTPQVAFGYFGQSSTATVETVTVDAFDNALGNVNIEQAFVSFTADNHTGVPVMLALTSATAGTQTQSGIGTVTIAEATRPGAHRITAGRIGGPLLGPIINSIIAGATDNVSFSFNSLTNPTGENPQHPNFITASPLMVDIRDVEVVVPLELSITDVVLRDTLEISFPDYTITSLGAKVYAVNNMPVAVALQGVLLDASGNVMYKTSPAIRDTLFLFPQPVAIAAPAVANGAVVSPLVSNLPLIALDPAMVNRLKDAHSIAISLRVNTSGNQTVVITDKNYVNVQVGVQVEARFDDIKNEL